ncbi:hypothetical protein AAMO2058_000039900 [Amorphochlora amoebiformis]
MPRYIIGNETKILRPAILQSNRRIRCATYKAGENEICKCIQDPNRRGLKKCLCRPNKGGWKTNPCKCKLRGKRRCTCTASKTRCTKCTSKGQRRCSCKPYKNAVGETPRCIICNKTMSSEDSRKHHMFFHLRIQPYGCPICNASFTYQSNLIIRHMPLHYGNDSVRTRTT